MAGPRRAQYVSIPLGPGVLSNTTGRGARTRQNYMNWDRWKDATWVRWHKLLPEKQGGWQYQALKSVVPGALVPGSPALLLHFDETSTPLNASLLLHFDGSFVDSSVYSNVMTSTGGVVESSQVKFGSGAMTVPATVQNFISTPVSAAGPLDLSTGDWTIEMFVYLGPSANPSGSTTSLCVTTDWLSNASTPALTASFLGGQVIIKSNTFGADTFFGTIATNTWTHVALTRQGLFLFLWLDGVQANTFHCGPTPLVMGGGPGLTVGASIPGQITATQGFLDEVRVTKGVAVYTAPFTPPTAPFPPSADIPNLSTTIDSSVYANPVNLNAAFGQELSLAAPKFGNAALAVSGANFNATYAVQVPYVSGSPLDLFLGGEWTLEGWIKATSATALPLTLFGYGDPGTGAAASAFQVVVIPAGDGATATYEMVDRSAWGTGVTASAAAQPLVTNTWYHVAVVSHAGVVTLYLNGNSILTGSALWVPANYIHAGSTAVCVGSFSYTNTGTQPGGVDEVRVTPIALYTTNFTPPTAANTLGVPNTLGTPTPPSAFEPATYVGLARDLHDWSSIDGQYWIAVGTHLKLYVVNQQTLYDVTPQRKTSNVVNALTTVATVAAVTVTDPGHQAATGDFVTITGAQVVGGLQIAGGYQITVVDPDTYTVLALAPASTAATGGGNFSIAYDIGTGLPANGELLGYGTGLYGALTFGTPRLAGQGVFARMRTWSLDNYGQDLVASQSDGEIYIWQRNSGPNSRAILLVGAPQGVQRVIVDAQQRVIIAMGCTDVTSAFNAMLVRWCSFDDITDWQPTDVNTAGDSILVAGSRIITGLKTKGQNLIFTDTTLYRMVFVGAPDIYDFIPAGAVTIVGPNAAVDVDGVAYLMGFDNFYNYSGTLNLEACDVWETVFDPTVPTSLNRAQSEAVVCYTYEPKTEVTWLYPSIGGALAVVFTGGLAQGATTATLAAPWAGATGIYTVEFDDQESQFVHLTAAQTGASWPQPLVGNVGASAVVIGCDRYVTFNWEDGTWYYGAWNRTAAQGRAPAMQGFPYGVNAGYLYQHEIGTDAVEAAGTVALGFSMQSLDITTGGAKSEYTMGGSDARFAIGGSDAHLLLRSILPDWKYFTGAMNLTIFTKDRPQDPAYVQSGPVAFDSTTAQIDIDANGSQMVIQLDNLTDAGAPSLGCSFRMGIFQGLAVPYVKR